LVPFKRININYTYSVAFIFSYLTRYRKKALASHTLGTMATESCSSWELYNNGITYNKVLSGITDLLWIQYRVLTRGNKHDAIFHVIHYQYWQSAGSKCFLLPVLSLALSSSQCWVPLVCMSGLLAAETYWVL